MHAGSYSESRGIEIIRKHIADFISRRDGVPCNYESVYLVNGAIEGIKEMLYMVMGGKCSEQQAGVLVPVPMFPLYNAALTKLGSYMVSVACNIARKVDRKLAQLTDFDQVSKC